MAEKIDGTRDTQTETYRPKEKEKAKEEKSEFDRTLEQNKQKLSQTASQKLTIREMGEYAAREGKRQDDREHEKDRERHKDRDRDGDRSQGERKRDTGILEQRVMAKGMLKDGQSGGQSSGEGRGQGFQGEMRKRQNTAVEKLASGKEGPVSLANRFEQQLKNTLMQSTKSEKLTQSILNQIVQSVRFGLNQEGEKEIQIRFQEQVFRGLKMRVSKKEGKVVVQFMTHDRKTREIFKRESANILAELQKKGITVAEMTVV